MVKTGKLTDAEKFYIEQNPDHLTIKEMADKLDRSLPLVGKHYKEAEANKVPDPPKTAEEVKNESRMFKLMGRKERKGQHVATVMTPAASELADAQRPQRLSSKKLNSAIHKPKG